MKKRAYRFHQDLSTQCPICHVVFRTPQAMKAHLRMVHYDNGPGYAGEGPSSVGSESNGHMPTANITNQALRQLRDEVNILKLQSEKRKLEAEFPPGRKPLDIMESAGLGGFDPEVKAGIQRRALVMEEKRNETWLDKILANPQGLKVAIDALRGILGTNRDGDSLSLLKELGFNLKDLITQAQSPKAGSDLEVGGVNLRGAVLTPDLLIALLKYREAEEAARAKVQAQKDQNEMVAEWLGKFKPLVEKYIDTRESSRFGGISQEIFNPEVVDVIKCPACGFENPMPTDVKPGDIIHCGGENCEQSWIAKDIRAEQKVRKTVKHEVKVKPAEPTVINCPNCNQAVDVTDKPLGSVIACPGCEQEFKITSDSIAMPAAEPLPKSKEDEKPLSRARARGTRRSQTCDDFLSG